jgi:hypothetical protein
MSHLTSACYGCKDTWNGTQCIFCITPESVRLVWAMITITVLISAALITSTILLTQFYKGCNRGTECFCNFLSRKLCWCCRKKVVRRRGNGVRHIEYVVMRPPPPVPAPAPVRRA